MAIGDDLAAAGGPITAGTEKARLTWQWINRLGDWVATRVQPINRGGTGATTAKGAAVAIGAWRNSGAVTPGETPLLGWNGIRLQATIPGYADFEVARLADVAAPSSLAEGPTSGAYSRAASGPATWYAVWMNAANQFMRNTSSRRYKKNIRDWQPPAGGVMGLRTVIFDRKGEDAPVDEVGFIAEEVLTVLPEAVAYYEGEVDGLNDRAIVAALVSHVQLLTREVEALKGAAS